MTTTDLAAALLRDVPRYGCEDQPLLPETEVLAALTAALDGVDERAGEVVERLRGRPDAIENVDRLRDEAADLITALLAQIAALRAEVRKSAMDAVSAGCQAQEAWEAQKAAEAKVKRLRAERDDALTFLDNAVSKAPEPLKALGKYLAGRLDEDEWPTAEQYLNAAAKACADRAEAAEAQNAALTARVERLTGALERIANEDEGDADLNEWGPAAVARAALSATTEADPAEAFNNADWFWRTMDPEDCGDTPEEAINRAMLGRFCVCEIASSYSGPTRYGFIAPVLDPESDDEEFVHFATQQEAIDAAKTRAATTKEKPND